MTEALSQTRVALILLVLLALSGCRSRDAAALDNRIVWDKNGCAFTIVPNIGDTSFVRPMKDANRESCPDD